MRKRIVAGNWKMNLSKQEAEQLITDLESQYENEKDCHVIICPSSIYLNLAVELQSNMSVGAQNVSERENGAFTGEISCSMLNSLGVDYVIVGHSERRQYFGDTNELINKKVKQLLANNITPILCCGESLEERESNEQEKVVSVQLGSALAGLSKEEVAKVVIAYEPVWAIGTGKTASAQQAQDIHAYIRGFLADIVGDVSNEISILYGGSCKPTNAKELFACEDIDGGLIGGAALDATSFLSIANSF
jgi:triosephosphate isomerase